MRRILRQNGLSLVVFGLFLVIFVFGQAVTGHRTYNDDQRDHQEPVVSFGEYVRTAHFGEATFENWESEFLQMGAYVLLTVWLRQRGSSESKKLEGDEPVDEDPELHRGDPDAPWPVRRGGMILAIYRNSLSVAFLACFALSWWLHAVTGARQFSTEQASHGGQSVTTLQFIGRAEFWFQSLQNWQSEFLAIAAIVGFSIFLRQKGSPESKPVHAPHHATGT